MMTEQTTVKLADKLRVNIERERIEHEEKRRRAAEEAARLRIANFATNLAKLKQDFISMADTGHAELYMTFGEEHILHEELQYFGVRHCEDRRRIVWVTAPMEPSLLPAWQDFVKWVDEQGLVLNFQKVSSHHTECDDYTLRLDLPQD